MKSAWMCLIASIGCGKVNSPPIDPDGATAQDAAPGCDPTAPFDAPVPLSRVDTYTQSVARLSPDELTLYTHGFLVTTDADLFVSQRTTTSEAFGAAARLTTVNSPSNDTQPAVGSDGLTLVFSSNRVPGEGSHLYVATRTSVLGEFGGPSVLAGVNSSAATDSESDPLLTADGQELWFASTRIGGAGGGDIYRAVKTGSQFSNPTPVAALNSTTVDRRPTLSTDKLTVYFTSDRDGSQGPDIWTSHRNNVADEFPTPTLAPNINTTGNDRVSWLSPDNCRLYLDSSISGADIIYVANRHAL